MTANKNDDRNWVVAKMTYGEGATLIVLFTEQAENVARDKAEKAALDYPNDPIFLYKREATVITEAVAKWQ